MENKFESLFMDLENTKPYAKVAFEGFAGDGKTYTAAQLAIGIHKLIKSEKPIVVVDTERAIDKLKPLFDEHNIQVKVSYGRSLATINQAIQACNEGFADVMLIDSITHVWENYLESYKVEKRRTQLQFQDWGIIKPKWKKEFSDHFVMANTHIIFTGRAGYEYEDEKNEETGKREIFKSGIKMKAEAETAFEPDMLILMEKVQKVIGEDKEIYRNATIIKDRTTKIDGKTFKNPSFEDFYPAIKVLLDGTLKNIHQDILPDTFKDYEENFANIVRKKDTAIAEIEGCFNLMKLGTGKEEKALKAAILNKVFGFTSIEAVSREGLNKIEAGLDIVRDFTDRYNEYLEKCATEQKIPDMNKVKNLLDVSIGIMNFS